MQRKSRTHRIFSSLIEALESRQLLSAGGLDKNFSSDGKTSASFSPLTGSGVAMAVQSDGKIVEVGGTSDGKLAMVRYNANGTLDTTFGSAHTGKVTLRYGSSSDVQTGVAVAIQSDNKIVVGSNRNSEKVDILRFKSDGTLDKSFDGDGVVNIDVGLLKNGVPASIAMQKDGKIVVLADTQENPITFSHEFLVVRLNTNGSLDNTFGDLKVDKTRTGKIAIDFGDSEFASAVAIDYNGTAASNPDFGKIVVAGTQVNGDDIGKVAVAKLTTTGLLDKSFDGDGKRLASAPGGTEATASSLVIEGNGSVVIAGSFAPKHDSTKNNAFLLMGFTPSGATDKTFGVNGIVKTSFSNSFVGLHGIINGFANHLIVVGFANGKAALAAYTLDGTLDPAFGTGGIVTPGGSFALAAGPNRTILVAEGKDFATSRFFDIAPKVSVTSFDSTAGEPTFKRIGKVIVKVPNPASMIVSRDMRLPFATRVFFTIGGTANLPNLANGKLKKNDYTLDGMTIASTSINSKTAFVDIPANETFATVTLNPVDDTAIESTETATFSINSSALYDNGTPLSSTISITDNDAPAAQTLTSTADAYVKDGTSANSNFGTATQMVVKKSSTSGSTRLSYLKFDLSSISSASNVQLQLFGNLNNANQTNVETDLYAVADTSWTETGITYNNKPAAGASVLAKIIVADTTPRLYTFDVTTYVKAQLAAGHKVISLLLKNPSTSDPAVLFNARESSSNRPTLVVT